MTAIFILRLRKIPQGLEAHIRRYIITSDAYIIKREKKNRPKQSPPPLLAAGLLLYKSAYTGHLCVIHL